MKIIIAVAYVWQLKLSKGRTNYFGGYISVSFQYNYIRLSFSLLMIKYTSGAIMQIPNI